MLLVGPPNNRIFVMPSQQTLVANYLAVASLITLAKSSMLATG